MDGKAVLVAVATAASFFATMTFAADAHQVDPGGTVRLETNTVDLIVTGNAGRELTAELRGPDDLVKKGSLAVNRGANGELVVKAMQGERSWHNWGNRPSLQLVVSVPSDANLTVATTGGDIKLSTVNAPLSIQTHSGDVSLSSVSGPVTISTTSGDIECSDMRSASIKADAHSGDVSVKTARADTKLEVRTTSGDVYVEFPKGARIGKRITTASGDVSDKIEYSNEPGETLIVRTNSGDVRLRESR
jgi:Putative adhesin